MSRFIIAFGVLLLISGCTSTLFSPEGIAWRRNSEVCKGYGSLLGNFIVPGAADLFKKEIEIRKLLTEEEWGLVSQKKIKNGMSLCALYALMGRPDSETPLDDSERRIRHVFKTEGVTYLQATPAAIGGKFYTTQTLPGHSIIVYTKDGYVVDHDDNRK